MMGFLWFILALIVLLIQAMAASEMQSIAEEKGSNRRYWAWCFWMPILGYLMVIALPDYKLREIKRADNTVSSVESDQLPDL